MRLSTPLALIPVAFTIMVESRAQTPAQPAPAVVPVARIERLEGGVVRVSFNLSPADARFAVVLEASNDGGRTFAIRPQAVRGDVGPNVQGGPGKAIEWEAGRDVEELQLDRLVFRILATPAPAAGGVRPSTPSSPPAVRPITGTLRVSSGPAGATVAIDGVARGRTPLTLSDLPAGDHRVTVTLAGYLENSRTVSIAPGREADVQVSLTPNPTPKGGGMPKWIIPVLGAGAAGAAVAAKSGGGGSPAATGNAVNAGTVFRTPPGVGVMFGTTFTFSANGFSSDVPLSYSWDFGDGTSAQGISARHGYERAGTFDIRVTATAGGARTVTVALSGGLQIVSMAGTWNGLFSNGGPFQIVVTQNGRNLTGTYVAGSTTFSGPGTIDDPKFWELDMTSAGGSRLSLTAFGSEAANTFTGTLVGFSNCADGLGPTTCRVTLTR